MIKQQKLLLQSIITYGILCHVNGGKAMNEEIMSHIDADDYDHKSIDACLASTLRMSPRIMRGEFTGDTFELQNLHHKAMYAPVTRIEGAA